MLITTLMFVGLFALIMALAVLSRRKPMKAAPRKRHFFQTIRFCITVFLLLGCFGTLEAQSQPGSVAIAGAIEPTVYAALEGHVKCVTGLKEAGISPNDALKSCENVVNRTTRAAEGMANSGQKAAQASRPVVVDNGWNRSYLGGRVRISRQPTRRWRRR